MACGVDADALRAETMKMKKLLLAVDRAFDPKTVMAWDTRLAARQIALADIRTLIIGGTK